MGPGYTHAGSEAQPLVRVPRVVPAAADNLRFGAALLVGLLCSGAAELGGRSEWLLWFALLLQTGLQFGLACWSDYELYRDACAIVRDQQPLRLRGFGALLSVYLLNVLAFTGPLCLSTALNPSSVKPPVRPDASVPELWLEACWDLTLVGSGTGFGERVPAALVPKLASWCVSVTVTIGLSNLLVGAVVGEVAMYAPVARVTAQGPLGPWGAR